MQNAIAFIEDNLLKPLPMEAIAASANSSPANFQRIFSIVTGMTVGDYIRGRRLSLAGQELAGANQKALDIALKYGYETAASFSKAFTRFHGATPAQVMTGKAPPMLFATLIINFVNTIDNGHPVIALVDMADNDMNVFFGYEDDGDKIIGYEYNKGFKPGESLPTDFSVPVTWGDWESKIHGYILLQSKTPTASEHAAALALFRTISDHARKAGGIRGKKVGFAAWQSFLHMLEHDDFSSIPLLEADAPTVDGVANSAQHRFFIYCDGLCQIDARHGALSYYRSLAEKFLEWQPALDTAIAALEACANYGGFLWGAGFSFNEAGFEKFRTAEGRKILADAGQEAMEKDMEAVAQFEKILQKEGGV